jgi:AraC-like DNA-binding protein
MVDRRLYFWGARCLYMGSALDLSSHRNAVAVVCAGLDAPFEAVVSPLDPLAGYQTHRTLLIPPNTLHHLRAGDTWMAFLYLDSQSSDYARLRASEIGSAPPPATTLAMQEAYLTALRGLREGMLWQGARAQIAAALGLAAPERPHTAVAEAIQRFRDDPAGKHPLADLASQAGLSPSRFLHLFKESTGVPLRRYRLWSRMGAAVRQIAKGASLTEAALDAGFASSAHFSAAFRDMFGHAPSGLAQARLRIEAEDEGVARAT